MRYEGIKRLSEGKFRRLTGVRRGTFELMLKTLEEAAREKKKTRRPGGRAAKLSLADKLLLTLCYLREYRTQFHLAADFGIDESYCCRVIRRVEDVLIKSKAFHLPGRKALLASEAQWEVIVIDATETPIERPKKTSALSTPAKRSGTPLKTSLPSKEEEKKSSLPPEAKGQPRI